MGLDHSRPSESSKEFEFYIPRVRGLMQIFKMDVTILNVNTSAFLVDQYNDQAEIIVS